MDSVASMRTSTLCGFHGNIHPAVSVGIYPSCLDGDAHTVSATSLQCSVFSHKKYFHWLQADVSCLLAGLTLIR